MGQHRAQRGTYSNNNRWLAFFVSWSAPVLPFSGVLSLALSCIHMYMTLVGRRPLPYWPWSGGLGQDKGYHRWDRDLPQAWQRGCQAPLATIPWLVQGAWPQWGSEVRWQLEVWGQVWLQAGCSTGVGWPGPGTQIVTWHCLWGGVGAPLHGWQSYYFNFDAWIYNFLFSFFSLIAVSTNTMHVIINCFRVMDISRDKALYRTRKRRHNKIQQLYVNV